VIPTRPLGPGGPPVTRLGLGLAALGRPAYLTLGHGEDLAAGRSRDDLERRAHAVLDAAWAAGIRYLDAARSYGDSERFLRRWLDRRGLTPGTAVVGTKWGYRYVGDWRLDVPRHEVKDHSAAALRAQADESRAILGGHLALLQIHSATPESGVLEDDQVLDGLARLRDGGLRLGVSVSGPSQGETVRRAIAVRRGGAPLFATVQATWNVLEPSAAGALEEAHASGVAVLVKEPLANGRLTARGDAGREGPLAGAARALATTPDAVALAAALAQPFADAVLLGPISVAQLEENLAALRVAPSPALLDELARLAEPAGPYWSRRAALPWT
jgi:aryl-alcohol dehydrogenase-like predicted oxidoreductase